MTRLGTSLHASPCHATPCHARPRSDDFPCWIQSIVIISFLPSYATPRAEPALRPASCVLRPYNGSVPSVPSCLLRNDGSVDRVRSRVISCPLNHPPVGVEDYELSYLCTSCAARGGRLLVHVVSRTIDIGTQGSVLASVKFDCRRWYPLVMRRLGLG